MKKISRRTCLAASLAGTGALLGASCATVSETSHPVNLPRWYGFNLDPKFMVQHNRRFVEEDFAWIRELGFNFVRIPMDYRCWIEAGDWTKFSEPALKEIDEGRFVW